MLIEIHIIQNHSPSNLNRDDLGAPKCCRFGGVTRARISSQCIKRSIRNPGNPYDLHNPYAGIFAKSMAEHIGTRTKLFPWLVEQALQKSEIPTQEWPSIVMAAKRIASNKEKKEKNAATTDKTDSRPKTPQLIHLGPGHASYFVNKLLELKNQSEDQYNFFLNPVVGFQELVRELLADSELEDKDRKKIVKESWTIAKCRMEKLRDSLNDEELDRVSAIDDGLGDDQARFIVERLSEFYESDQDKFKSLLKAPTEEEKKQVQENIPKKPPGMDAFLDDLKSVNQCHAVDIALFGRMTTSDYFQDVEASMQVAHALSTHEVINEVDYFTAVDDLGKVGGGAGHVGESMFNSPCFYKYFCLDWDQLVNNLAGPQPEKPNNKDGSPEVEKWHQDYNKWESELRPEAEKLAAATLGHLIRAAAITNPSGKQNSFAANNQPSGILVEIKKNKIPTSYANAFTEPAHRIGNPPDDAPDYVSLVGRSIAQFGDHVYNVRKAYGIDSMLFWHALPLYLYPLQGWQREDDGRRKKDNKGENVLPPLLFTDWDACAEQSNTNGEKTHQSFAHLGGENEKPEGLIEAVVKAVGFDWSEIKDAGKASPMGA